MSLKTILDAKTLDDLVDASVEPKPMEQIKPTTAEINTILGLLKQGKKLPKIRKEVLRNYRCFTAMQIRRIAKAREARITELTPVSEPII